MHRARHVLVWVLAGSVATAAPAAAGKIKDKVENYQDRKAEKRAAEISADNPIPVTGWGAYFRDEEGRNKAILSNTSSTVASTSGLRNARRRTPASAWENSAFPEPLAWARARPR